MIALLETLRPAKAELIDSALNGVRLSMLTMPALSGTSGGDWCEAFALAPHLVALSIGDVCGHGPGSSGTMTALRELIRSCALRGLNPSEALAEASWYVRQRDPGMPASALLGVLDTRSRRLTFGNAGHPPLLMVGPDGARFLEFERSDLPLGVLPGTAPSLHVVNVPQDTLLVFYTDGVIERERDALRGERDLLAVAQRAYRQSALPSASLIERELSLGGHNADDVAIMTAWTPRFSTKRENRISVISHANEGQAALRRFG